VLALASVSNEPPDASGQSPAPAVTIVVTRPDTHGQSRAIWNNRKGNATSKAHAKVVPFAPSADGEGLERPDQMGWTGFEFLTPAGELVEISGTGISEEAIEDIAASAQQAS
jgi:hypothetical protein